MTRIRNKPDQHDQKLPSAADVATEIAVRMDALGHATTAELRALRREFSQRLAQTPATFIVELALALLAQRNLSHRFVAYELVQQHKQAMASLNASRLEQLGRGLDSWAAVDTFGCYLSGPAWREQQVADSLIHRWAVAKDRWWRRAALVSTVALNIKARGGRGDARRTLPVCELLIDDRDDMVVKALSWALRALATRDGPAVEEFLVKHQKALAPRVIREVRNKLRTGLKNPRV